jgi:hypothetical protein
MKSKVKESKKDINIVIEIENNLLSKNKMKHDEESNQKKKTNNQPNQPNQPNQRVSANNSRLLSEYLGVMAQRDLYRQSQSPFNIQQYITPPMQNQIGGSPLIQQLGSAPYQLYQPAIQNQNDDDDDTDDEETDNLLNMTALDPDVPDHDSDNEGEDALLTQPETTPSAVVVTENELRQSILDDPNAEEEFISEQSVAWKKRRNEIIENIKNKQSKLYLKTADVLKYKLGRYVQTFRMKRWKNLMKKANSN